ncbi:MAG: hypothetical protein COB51_12050 [Moraxellaceae bacterium]|nr:MAG: hypothetical protein COB51_12050 [Moraxellaceae bacterium]
MKAILNVVLTTTILAYSMNAFCLEKGQALPHFSLTDLRSGNLIQSDDFKGKVIYIDFWATWCAPCIEGLPKLGKLQNSFSKDQFQVVAINVNDDVETVEAYLEKIDANLMILSDPKNIALSRFKLKGIPSGFLISQDGKVVLSHTGYDANFIKHLKKEIHKQIKSQ